jgi:hypothetical protein
VLALTEPTELAPSGIAAGAEQWFSFLLPPTTAGVAAPSGAAAAGVVGLAGLGPVGLAAAAAAAVPSIISLFSSTTTVKDHTEDITDLTTTTSVLAAVADKLSGYTLVHEDFRLAPEKSQIREDYRLLADRRARLIIRQQQMQAIKNGAGAWLSGLQVTDEELARYGAQQPEPEAEPAPEAAAASEAESRAAVREELESVSAEADQLAQQDAERQAERVAWIDEAGINEPVVRFDSVSAAAALPVISGAITSIDEFTTAVNATAAGARSPLAIASLNELLHQGGADGISYVLSVKVLGGRSEQYTKDRRVGFDTYTTLARRLGLVHALRRGRPEDHQVGDSERRKLGPRSPRQAAPERRGRHQGTGRGRPADEPVRPAARASQEVVAPLVLSAPARSPSSCAPPASGSVSSLASFRARTTRPASCSPCSQRCRDACTSTENPPHPLRPDSRRRYRAATPTCGLASSRETWPPAWPYPREIETPHLGVSDPVISMSVHWSGRVSRRIRVAVGASDDLGGAVAGVSGG